MLCLFESCHDWILRLYHSILGGLHVRAMWYRKGPFHEVEGCLQRHLQSMMWCDIYDWCKKSQRKADIFSMSIIKIRSLFVLILVKIHMIKLQKNINQKSLTYRLKIVQTDVFKFLTTIHHRHAKKKQYFIKHEFIKFNLKRTKLNLWSKTIASCAIRSNNNDSLACVLL